MKKIKEIKKLKDGKEEFDYYEVVNDDDSITTNIQSFHWQYKMIEEEIKEKKVKVKKETRNEEKAI